MLKGGKFWTILLHRIHEMRTFAAIILFSVTFKLEKIMKNLVKTIVLALVLMCGATSANAQLSEGENAIGVNFGYGVGSNDFGNLGLGIRYNRHLSDALRLDLNGMYYFKSGLPGMDSFAGYSKGDLEEYTSGKSTSWFDVNLNAHYLFSVADNIYVYPIFGFTTMFGKTDFKWNEVATKDANVPAGQKMGGSYSDNHFRFGVNLGFGGQYNITDDFGLTLEAKYKLVSSHNKFGHFNVALGCVVMF